MTAPFALATGTAVRHVEVGAYRIATDAPESDGTIAWDSTTIVVAEVAAADARGLGYAYANAAAAHLIRDTLAGVVEGRDALAVPGIWRAMAQAAQRRADRHRLLGDRRAGRRPMGPQGAPARRVARRPARAGARRRGDLQQRRLYLPRRATAGAASRDVAQA